MLVTLSIRLSLDMIHYSVRSTIGTIVAIVQSVLSDGLDDRILNACHTAVSCR